MKLCLSIDGGGIKGILPAMILERLEHEYGAPTYQIFDLICGVSTGGIIASAAAVGIPAAKIVELYAKEGPNIFKRSLTWKLRTLFGLIGPKYSNEALEEILYKIVHYTVLGDILKPLVLPVQDIHLNEPLFLKSHNLAHLGHTHSFGAVYLKDAMLAAAAAPTYFPPVQLTYHKQLPSDEEIQATCIDGGIINNNPALFAYIEARTLWPEEDIMVLSLATAPDSYGYSSHDFKHWGLIQWARKFINLSMSAANDSANYVLRQTIRPEQDIYIRLVPPKSPKGMDAASKEDLRDLVSIGNEYLLENTINLHNIAMFLKRFKDSVVGITSIPF